MKPPNCLLSLFPFSSLKFKGRSSKRYPEISSPQTLLGIPVLLFSPLCLWLQTDIYHTVTTIINLCVVACVRCRWKSLLFEYKRILLIGRAIWTRHIRNGKELPEIARDDHYDFNFQVGVLLVHLNLTNRMCSVKKYYPVLLFTSQPEIIKAGARNISCWDVRQTHYKIVSCWYLLAWLFCHHRI